jgi:hypothetical protein
MSRNGTNWKSGQYISIFQNIHVLKLYQLEPTKAFQNTHVTQWDQLEPMEATGTVSSNSQSS